MGGDDESDDTYAENGRLSNMFSHPIDKGELAIRQTKRHLREMSSQKSIMDTLNKFERISNWISAGFGQDELKRAKAINGLVDQGYEEEEARIATSLPDDLTNEDIEYFISFNAEEPVYYNPLLDNVVRDTLYSFVNKENSLQNPPPEVL